MALMSFSAAAEPQPAPEAHPVLSRAALQQLADSFVSRIGRKMKETDMILKGGDKLKIAELQSGTIIPENEPLIFQVLIGARKIRADVDVNAERKNDRLMVSFGEFTSAIDFPISVSPEKGEASGWFIHEGRIFYLDSKKNEVTVQGQTQKIDPADISSDENDIYVSSMAIEKWFGIKVDIDLSNLTLLVSAPQQLPIELRAERNRKMAGSTDNAGTTEAKLPLKKEPYRMFSMPNLDVSARASTSRNAAGDPFQQQASYSVLGAGDLLGFSSQFFISGDKQNYINTYRQSFTREDTEANLLGPLHATLFTFGDIYTVETQLTGGASQEQGIRASNLPRDNITSLDTVDIRGDAQPGWDVELYRDENFISLQQVDATGQYNFPNTFLYAGDNNFRLVFYGPQGEIREEKRTIVANASNLAMGQGAWDVSLSRINTTTYEANTPNTPIDGDPRLTMSYQYGLGDLGALSFGLIHRSELRNSATIPTAVEKNYLQTGISTSYLGTLINADLAYDIDGEYTTRLVARRNFGQHQMGLVYQNSSDEFSQDSSGNFAPTTNLQVNARGPLTDEFMGLKRVDYTAELSHIASAAGGTTDVLTGSISGRRGSISATSGMQYLKTTTPDETSLLGFSSLRGFYGKGRWGFTSNYDTNPMEIKSLNASYSYPFTNDIEGAAQVTHTVQNSFSEAELSLNWRTNKMIISPRILANTDKRIEAGVNVRFGLTENPYTGKYEMINRSVSSTGGAAGRIFLDLNGNGLYDEGEKLLSEAELRSVQLARTGYTNADGIAVLNGIPQGTKTDVVLNPSSLDSYYTTLEEGASIRARPGITTKFDFPVVVAGEIDGQAQIALEDGEYKDARNTRISLVTPNGTVAESAMTAYDGYYDITPVKPGIYYLVTTPPKGTDAYALPLLLDFTATGVNYYGQNIVMTPDYRIDFRFRSNNPPPTARATRVGMTADIDHQDMILRLGDYRSHVTMAVAWYKFRMRGTALNDYFDLVTPLAQIEPEPKTATMSIMLKPRAALNMEKAASACRAFIKEGFTCGVDVVTTYKTEVPTAAVPETPKDKKI